MAGILDILNVVGTVVDRVIPDPKDKLELQEKLAAIADQEAAREHEEVMGQIQIDTVEAGNANLFVSGWRPFIGWVCGAGAAYSFVLYPFIQWGSRIFGFHGELPSLDTGELMSLVMAMLGMGYMRHKEKIGGVADSGLLPASELPAVAKPKKKILGVAWPF